MFVKKNRFWWSGDAIVFFWVRIRWRGGTQRECNCRAKHRAKHRSLPCLKVFQGQTCAKVDATRSSSQLLAALSIKIRHATLLMSSWAAVIVRCSVAIRGSIIEDASPPRRIESDRRSGNDTPFYSRTRLYFQSTFSQTALELYSKCRL